MSPYFFATLVVGILYAGAGVAIRRRWDQRIVLNPLKMLAASGGSKASLSTAQILFFTLVVLWLVLFWAFQDEGTLLELHSSVLALLGIAAVGTGVGKATDSARFRPSRENLAWAMRKKWVKKDFTQTRVTHTPTLGDLITTDQGFDVSRFQSVGFSLVVGISLLYQGIATESGDALSISVDETYLLLVGISQGAYVGGKLVGDNLFRDLNSALDKVRQLEREFIVKVANSENWEQTEDMTTALECAPTEYIDYMTAAKSAATIVEQMTGNRIADLRTRPDLPNTL